MHVLILSVKDFENRLTFGEVMGKSLVSCLLTRGVFYLLLILVISCVPIYVKF